MDNELTTEQDIIYYLWSTWHGPTGFKCRCGCTRGYPRGRLGRSKVCRDCGTEISVTADTLMRNTRLPLRAWVYALRCTQDERRIPTARSVAALFDCAVSSAWHLVQRVLRWAEARRAEEAVQCAEVVRIALRAPRAPMVSEAPEGIVALDASGEREVSVRLSLAGDRVWRDTIGVDEPAEPEAHPVCAWLEDQLRTRGYVSLRWLPRWLDAMLCLWESSARRRWDEIVRSTRPVPLVRLDPWLA